jgi:hypothetical protein
VWNRHFKFYESRDILVILTQAEFDQQKARILNG